MIRAATRTTTCGLCYQSPDYNNHMLKNCPVNKSLKPNISRNPYFADCLQPCDEAAFCAAGIIPFYKENDDCFLLSVRETRHGIQALNFAAGKRECVQEGDETRVERSIETAMNEFEEEMSEVATSQSLRPLLDDIRSARHCGVYLCPESKIALYFYKVDKNYKHTLQKQGPTIDAEVDDFEWISLNSPPNVFHTFVHPIMRNLRRIRSRLMYDTYVAGCQPVFRSDGVRFQYSFPAPKGASPVKALPSLS